MSNLVKTAAYNMLEKRAAPSAEKITRAIQSRFSKIDGFGKKISDLERSAFNTIPNTEKFKTVKVMEGVGNRMKEVERRVPMKGNLNEFPEHVQDMVIPNMRALYNKGGALEKKTGEQLSNITMMAGHSPDKGALNKTLKGLGDLDHTTKVRANEAMRHSNKDGKVYTAKMHREADLAGPARGTRDIPLTSINRGRFGSTQIDPTGRIANVKPTTHYINSVEDPKKFKEYMSRWSK